MRSRQLLSSVGYVGAVTLVRMTPIPSIGNIASTTSTMMRTLAVSFESSKRSEVSTIFAVIPGFAPSSSFSSIAKEYQRQLELHVHGVDYRLISCGKVPGQR